MYKTTGTMCATLDGIKLQGLKAKVHGARAGEARPQTPIYKGLSSRECPLIALVNARLEFAMRTYPSFAQSQNGAKKRVRGSDRESPPPPLPQKTQPRATTPPAAQHYCLA